MTFSFIAFLPRPAFPARADPSSAALAFRSASAGTVLVTCEMPSTNLVRKITLALLNIPSLRETTTNCECGKCCLIIRPMFCVWERSRAASTSSRMYRGAGLKRSSARIRERARSDLCPPDSSVRLCFHTPPNATLTSRPSYTSIPSGASSLAVVPGSSVEKMLPKSLVTFAHVARRASRFFSSSSEITSSILVLSFSTIRFLLVRAWYSCSALSNMLMTLRLTFLPSLSCTSSAARSSLLAATGSRASKS
mmetsp:Transcript_18205/g.58882  ORF Transcript_18205/g.58882 Transcript_18205/m.58882 type:complete len:251 (+) Transcript_18205:18-770(+)